MNGGQSESPIDALAATGSRRTLVGATLAGALGLLTLRDGAAKHKHKHHKKTTTSSPPPSDAPTSSPDPAPPVRGTVSQIFSSTTPITIPNSGDTDGGNEDGSAADPYPSTIEVSGFANGAITDVKVHLNGLSHTYPDDIDIMLAAAHLHVNATVLSDVGGSIAIDGVNLVLDDAASEDLPDSLQLTSGTFRPTNKGSEDPFPSPAPAPSGNRFLNTFQGRFPNGTWQLFISDGAAHDTGSLGGWALEITAEVDLPAASGASLAPAKARHGSDDARARRKVKRGRNDGGTHHAGRHKRQR